MEKARIRMGIDVVSQAVQQRCAKVALTMDAYVYSGGGLSGDNSVELNHARLFDKDLHTHSLDLTSSQSVEVQCPSNFHKASYDRRSRGGGQQSAQVVLQESYHFRGIFVSKTQHLSHVQHRRSGRCLLARTKSHKRLQWVYP